MRQHQLSIHYLTAQPDELLPAQQELIEAACQAATRAYAPYSHFCVGAAVRLQNGQIFAASNQENASYPEGICAERNAIFYAGSTCPDSPIVSLAIAARCGNSFTAAPITPCGACRQVITEAIKRSGIDFNVLLFGSHETIIVPRASDLLPLCFSGKQMS